MNIQNIKISKIKPYENNPRVISDEAVDKVMASIKEFGFQQPIVCDKDMVIIVGHTRLKAAKKLGLNEVPVIIADNLTDEQAKAYRLADNKVGEFSKWADDALSFELSELECLNFNMEPFGFEIEEEFEDAVEDEFEPVIPEEPYVQKGELYLLGRHRLLVGDSTDENDVKRLMDGELADLMVTYPPYNVALGMGGSVDEARKRHRRTDGLVIMNDKMEDNEFYQFLLKFYKCAADALKPGASFYIWHADNEGLNFRMALKDAGLQLRQTLIWNKNSITLGRQDYQWKHEPCLYGWKDGSSHNWYSDRKQSTVIDMNRPAKSELHPTMKPIGLFDYQIKNSSKPNDAVLYLFGGSGTTIMACEQNGRRAFSMELDPRYAQTIIERWEQFTGQKAVKVG